MLLEHQNVYRTVSVFVISSLYREIKNMRRFYMRMQVPTSHCHAMAVVAVLCLAALLVVAEDANHTHTDPKSASRRIIAVGDVHGDLAQLRAVLEMANIINDDGAWVDRSGAVVVQVGDLLDRGPHDKGVMDFLMQLQAEAPTHGGAVVVLLGNHELMNLMEQFHYVHPESHEFFEGKSNRRRHFSTEGVYGNWLRSNPLVHVEGSTVFVHAGISPQFAAMGVEKMNQDAKAALAQRNIKGLDRSPLFGVHGPIWTRLLITDAMTGRCGDVKESLSLLPGVDRMVVGHTPQRSGRIETFCDDTLIAVDVGLSKWMYGNLAALEITELHGGGVELREIVPHTAVESKKEKATQDVGVATNVESAVNDPLLLQELIEAIQELKDKQQYGSGEARVGGDHKSEDEAAIDKLQGHDEF
jgi:hypothetical protein